ncbi:YqaE/Pmp3 family membrane protein [Leptolyngbya sp. FACHB-261]|uniref:YqaE/Pmp3 family membrane protein n=1 Tax=Leptolyngbya sp. FACHB-261 TaxID=2692806 RepID=UPI001689B359|nr:YqaE/Pmp3 family membrane protein [Leptolyngbya sp. FACHB-261]MBD2099286.1 YqaE/Pmp3 family membrane protein [Leptolyngbya sp. FACHB-261]
MNILRIIFAILLPPLGVFLTTGVSSALLVNILLTLLGYVPGIIHAVWIIAKQNEAYGDRA